jgi:hypothetical protein
MIPRKLNVGIPQKSLIQNISVTSKLVTKPLVSNFNPNGQYSNKTDLQEVNQFCLECFDKIDISPVKNKIKHIQQRLDTEIMFMIDRRKLEYDLDDLKKIPDPEIDRNNFIKIVTPILSEWETAPLNEKHIYIRAYIQAAQDFKLPLSMTKEPNKNGICPDCENPYITDDDQIICFQCDKFYDTIVQGVEYNDIGRINTSNVNNYEEESFEDAKICYQGKQVCNFPADLFQRVDNYIQKKGINKFVLRPIDMMDIWRDKDVNYREYRNVYLFMSIWNNYKLQDFTLYDSILDQDNHTFMQFFEELKAQGIIERDSAPNGYFRLYIFCEYRGITCDKAALKIPDGRKTLLDLDSIARKVFECMGRNYKGVA